MFRIPTSVLLLVGLILATCVIAYWSDNLGKKLGKKRISLFGLRPRQTATLISMVTSVGIMLFTLAVLMIFSSQVRDAILRVDRLRDNNQKLRRENDKLVSASNQLKASVNRSQEQAWDAEKRAAKAASDANEATNSANKRVADAQGKIAETDRRLNSARGQLNQAVSARQAAQQGQIRAAQGERLARRHASEAVKQLAQVRDLLDGAKEQYSEINLKLKKSQQALTAVYKSNLTLLRASQSQKLQIARGKRDIEDLQDKLGPLNLRLTAAREEYASLVEKASRISTGTVVIDLGQVFAEIVVPPKVEASKLRTTLHRLLDAGAVAASKLGGKSYVNPDTGIKRALHLATFNLPDNQGSINENDFIEHFVNYLSTLNVPISVRLVAIRRYAEGENEFQAKLEAVPVNRIYAQGDTVATATIDGSLRDAVIFNRLVALVNEGGKLARQKGVTPLLSEEVPEFFATGTNEQIFDTLRALQVQGKPMHVRMVAAEDIYSVDPMNVKFILESDSE